VFCFSVIIPNSEIINVIILKSKIYYCRSQRPRGLRCRFAVARLLRSRVRIPPGAWKFVCCECCVLSGRGLCDGLITQPEESYRLWCVVVCDLETLWMRRPWPAGGCSAKNKQTNKQTNRKKDAGMVSCNNRVNGSSETSVNTNQPHKFSKEFFFPNYCLTRILFNKHNYLQSI
jgi:hypothetical protein